MLSEHRKNTVKNKNLVANAFLSFFCTSKKTGTKRYFRYVFIASRALLQRHAEVNGPFSWNSLTFYYLCGIKKITFHRCFLVK